MAGIWSLLLQVPQSLHGLSGNGLAFLLDATLKGTALLLLSGMMALALRRASAAARHLVWSLGLGALLALPILALMLPAWNLPVISALSAGFAGDRLGSKAVSAVVGDQGQFSTDDAEPPSPAANEPRRYSPNAAWILSLWAFGSMFLAARLAVGEARVRRMAKRSQPLEARQAASLLENLPLPFASLVPWSFEAALKSPFLSLGAVSDPGYFCLRKPAAGLAASSSGYLLTSWLTFGETII